MLNCKLVHQFSKNYDLYSHSALTNILEDNANHNSLPFTHKLNL